MPLPIQYTPNGVPINVQPTGGGPMLGPQQPMGGQPMPQYGLAGSELALTQGLGGALGTLGAAGFQGRQDINAAASQGLGQLSLAGQRVGNQIAQGRMDLSQAQQRVGNQIGQGVSALNPYNQQGQAAQGVQGDLSGANGPEAQAQAFANYQSSPGQDWFREQGMRGLQAEQALIGGSGGGNRLKEMNRYNAGLAAQNYGADFNRLGSLSDRGLQAGQSIGQLRGQQAGISSALGQAGANLASNQAGISSALGQQGANIYGNRGDRLSSMGQNLGGMGAGFITNTGINMATGRTNAGRDIAGNIQTTTGGLADLLSNQGGTLADLIGQGGAGMQNMIIAAQGGDANAMQSLSALLANINNASGSQISGVNQTAYDPTSTYQGIASGLSDLVGAFGSGGQQQPAGYQQQEPPAWAGGIDYGG